MKTIEQRIDVKAHLLEAFDCAQHYANRKTWDPFIARLKHRDELSVPIHLRTMVRLKMKCEYLKYDKPKCVKIKMVEGPGFLKEFIGTWRFIYLDAERTAVIYTYAYELDPGRAWMKTIVEGYFQWDMKRRLIALKNELEQDVDLLEEMEQRLMVAV